MQNGSPFLNLPLLKHTPPIAPWQVKKADKLWDKCKKQPPTPREILCYYVQIHFTRVFNPRSPPSDTQNLVDFLRASKKSYRFPMQWKSFHPLEVQTLFTESFINSKKLGVFWGGSWGTSSIIFGSFKPTKKKADCTEVPKDGR